MKKFSALLLLLILMLAGCKSEPKDFKLSFTMESLKSYKLSIEISSDKSYSIKQENLFFDLFAKKEQINSSQGKLTDEEFKELTNLIAHARLFEMKDVYGFDKKKPAGGDAFEGFIYQMDYTEGSKSKYILIRPNPTNTYPGKFPQLMSFLSNYISKH
jgi:hypothetical protein